MKNLRALIVDDSAVMRKIVVGRAQNQRVDIVIPRSMGRLSKTCRLTVGYESVARELLRLASFG
jgi:hypothetical protein